MADELPQGVAMILSGVNSQFTDGIYLNLGDLFDIIAPSNVHPLVLNDSLKTEVKSLFLTLSQTA